MPQSYGVIPEDGGSNDSWRQCEDCCGREEFPKEAQERNAHEGCCDGIDELCWKDETSQEDEGADSANLHFLVDLVVTILILGKDAFAR